MTIFTSSKQISWGAFDIPLLGLDRDWLGGGFDPPAGYALVQDQERLWFVVHHRKPASIHPKARPGVFLADLWKYDAAELFLMDPKSGRYIEWNLAPNGAWWSCEFLSARVRADEQDIVMPDVQTYADLSEDGSWVAAMSLPLDLLRARLDFGPYTMGNVAMVLNSPEQRLLSLASIGEGKRDLHRPEIFQNLKFIPLAGQSDEGSL